MGREQVARRHELRIAEEAALGVNVPHADDLLDRSLWINRVIRLHVAHATPQRTWRDQSTAHRTTRPDLVPNSGALDLIIPKCWHTIIEGDGLILLVSVFLRKWADTRNLCLCFLGILSHVLVRKDTTVFSPHGQPRILALFLALLRRQHWRFLQKANRVMLLKHGIEFVPDVVRTWHRRCWFLTATSLTLEICLAGHSDCWPSNYFCRVRLVKIKVLARILLSKEILSHWSGHFRYANKI